MINLIHGDCLEEIPKLQRPDLVLADMPYGKTQCPWDSLINLPDLWLALDHIHHKTPVILFAQTPFDKVLGASNIERLRYEWIWEKTAATGFFNAKKMPMKAHENILVFYNKLPTYNPQKTTGHKPVNSYTKRNGDGECYGKGKIVSGGGSTERYPRSVQVFKSDKQKVALHSTQKPVALMEMLIKTYSNYGDTILDFCMGSGTTGIACLNTGRDFIGIEKKKKHFDVAVDRISKHNDKLNVRKEE